MADIFSELDKLYEILGTEVEWCAEHFNDDATIKDDYKRGFIEGLKQSQRILIDFEISIIKGDNEWIKSKS